MTVDAELLAARVEIADAVARLAVFLEWKPSDYQLVQDAYDILLAYHTRLVSLIDPA
jgi:hypothetical protein